MTILLLAGGGGFYAFKKLKGKKAEKAQEKPDPDADYVDEEITGMRNPITSLQMRMMRSIWMRKIPTSRCK